MDVKQKSGNREEKGAKRPRLFACDRGAAAVEFAIVLPILVMLVFGIYEFGRGYNAKITLTHAAREGVRAYTISGNATDGTDAAVAAAPGLPGRTATVTVACTPGGDGEVTVSWDLVYTVPLVSTGTINMSESATMRCGG